MSRVVLISAEAQSMEKKFFGRFVALALDITAPVLFGLLFTFNLYGWNQGMFYISAGQAGKNSTIAAADGDSDERWKRIFRSGKATDVEKENWVLTLAHKRHTNGTQPTPPTPTM